MESTTTQQKLLALIVLPGLILALVWASTPLIERNGGLDYDGVYYAAMASAHPADPSLARIAPYCWRVVTPFLASLLPFGTITNFEVLAFLSNWLALALLYGLLRRSGLSYRASLLGMLLYAGIFWTVKFSFYSPCYIDYQTQAISLAILYLMLRRRYWALPALLALGVLQKESIIFLVPIVYVHYAGQYGWLSRKTVLFLALSLILPALAVVAVRAWVHPIRDYAHTTHYLTNLRVLLHRGFWPRFAVALFSGLGILPALVAYRARQVYPFLRRNLHWALLVAIGILSLFGGTDKARLFLYMLPAAVVFAAEAMEPVLVRPKGAAWVWLGGTLLLHFYLGNLLTPMGTYEDYLRRMVPEHAIGPVWGELVRIGAVLLLWVGLTLWYAHRRAEKAPSPASRPA